MQIRILRDDAARELLAADDISREWERLYRVCPWATIFQSPAFVRTWYDCYRATHAPVVVVAQDPGAPTLRGLLTLAVPERGARRLVAAGGEQAEYQSWLTAAEDGDDFPLAAFEGLSREMAGMTLLLRYTPPKAPLAWIERSSGASFRVSSRAEPRPLIDLSDLSSVEQLLAGEYYRRRQNWLKRNGGEIRIERVTEPAAFDALLEEFVPLCDLRQGARYGALPFRDDPVKASFHRALMRQPGVLEVTVLRAGPRIASVHIDGNNRGELELGMLAHPPSLSRGAPGALHNLYLARELARQGGWRAMDLTPGGSYKDDLANRRDEVHIVHVFFSEAAHARHVASQRTRGAAKRLLVRAGGSTERARERIDELAAAVRAPRRAAQALAHRVWSTDTVELLAIDAAVARRLEPTAADSLRRNDFAALTAYVPRGPLDATREEFLDAALRRLEAGQTSLTESADGRLVACGWLASGDKPLRLDGHEQPVTLSKAVALLHDVRVDFAALNGGAAGALRAMITAAAQEPGTQRVLVAVRGRGSPLAVALQQLGLRHAGGLYRSSRFGTVRLWSNISPGDLTVATTAGGEKQPSHAGAA